jgi:hypothetical protein
VTGTGGAVGGAGTGGAVGSGGAVGTGGVLGTGGVFGSGGSSTCTATSNDCGARTCGTGKDNCGKTITCGTCGTNQDCADNSKCLPANLIEDFADCNNAIYAMSGRQGYWYDWASPPTLIAEGSPGTSPPPSAWGVTQCGAWMTGGVTSPSGDEDAGMGVSLNNKSTYDACNYNGIEVTYGSANKVKLSFKYGTSTKYKFLTLPATTSTTSQRVPFPDGICGELVDIQFIPDDYESYGFAVYKLSFY